MGCEYRYRLDAKSEDWSDWMDYRRLLSEIDADEFKMERISDLLFSSSDRQGEQERAIRGSGRKMTMTSGGGDAVDGGTFETDADVETRGDRISARSFMNTKYFTVYGESPEYGMTKEKYAEDLVKGLVNSGQIRDEAAAAKYAETALKTYAKVREDSKVFHRLMDRARSAGGAVGENVEESAEGTAFAGIAESLAKIENNIFMKIVRENSPVKSDDVPEGERGKTGYLPDMFFEADLRNGGEYGKMGAHADYIAVREDGSLEIYNFVTSLHPLRYWNGEKLDHYRYEMAFLKRAMSQNGIDVSRARVKIIPVQLRYDDTFTNVTEVNVGDPLALDMVGGEYIADRFDAVAGQYVESGAQNIRLEVKALKAAMEKAQWTLPGVNVREAGIAREASKWAETNWRFCNPRPREGGGYILTMPTTGVKVELSDTRIGAENEEFVKWLEDDAGKGYDPFSGERSASIVIGEVMDCYQRKGYYDVNEMNFPNAPYMKELMAEYFNDKVTETDSEGNKTFNFRWAPVREAALLGANLIGMVNKDTNQLDIVCVTSNDPGELHEFKGRKECHNIMGAYKVDNVSPWLPDATWGMIEAERVMLVINEMAKDLAGRYKLGKLKVVCLNGNAKRKGAVYSFDYMTRVFDEIVKITNRCTKGRSDITNNIRGEGLSCIRPEEAFVSLYRTITENFTDSVDYTVVKGLKDRIDGYRSAGGAFMPGLLDAATVEAKTEILQDMIMALRDELGSSRVGVKPHDTDKMRELIVESPDSYGGILSRLYVSACQLLSVYNRTYVPDIGELSKLEDMLQRADVVTEQNHQMCVTMVQDSYNSLNARMTEQYINGSKSIFDEAFEASGYGKLRNKVIGDTTTVYANMYVRDEQGRNTFMFKNPYDPNSELAEWERRFIKKVAYEFYKVRCRMNGDLPSISGPDDPVLLDTLPEGYLNLPLQRASVVSRRTNLKSQIGRLSNFAKRCVTDLHGVIKEVKGKITDTKAKKDAERSWEEMTVYNRFLSQENYNTRVTMLAEHGEDWFETDVENVFIDYLYTQTKCEEFNRLLISIGALELGLELKGIDFNDTKKVENLMDSIREYVKVNVHGGTPMEDESIYLMNITKGLRKLTSEVFFGNNIYGCVRDCMLGLTAGFTDAALKLHSDITVKDLSKAYTYVLADCFKSLGDMALLDRLNLKWGFSSFDYGNLAARLKRQGGGAFDWGTWIYWTMKWPDFINRMTLLVARMVHDGSFGAYKLDGEGHVVYNWRDDARFDVLARVDRSDPRHYEKLSPSDRKRYNDQLTLYCKLMEEFNMENVGERQLKMTDDLPDGYTLREIRSIKHLGEQLYGAYDKASRNRMHHTLIGRMFMPYFTWPGGLMDVYGRKLGPSSKTIESRRRTNERGEQLFYKQDDRTLTTENTGVPAMEMTEGIDEGVISSVVTMFRHIAQPGNNLRTYYETHVKDNPLTIRNWKILARDMSITAIFTALLLGLVKPAYKKRKEELDPQAFAENAAIEILYRGWARSADYFSGPLLLFKYFGDSTNPVAYDMGTKIITDMYKVLAGKNTFGSTLLSYSATYRSVQDSMKLLFKDMNSQNPPDWAKIHEPGTNRVLK